MVYLGSVKDIEEDNVYMKEWDLGGEAYEWVTFMNQTDPNQLYFEIKPPADQAEIDFGITFSLVDTNTYSS